MIRLKELIVSVALLVVALMASGQGAASDNEIRLGSSLPLTGPVAQTAKLFESGARLYFDRINAEGGVHKRKIAFEVLDDGFDSAKAVANSRELVNERNVIALFGNAGTAQVAGVLPLVAESNTPLFGPATGSPALRKQHLPMVFHVRASYRDELERIVDHAKTVGLRRIAIFHTDDALGKLVLAELQDALKKRDWQLVVSASAAMKDGDLEGAAKRLASQQPQAIVMGTVGVNFARFISAYKAQDQRTPQFYGLSLVDPGLIASELGESGRGIVLSQIIPSVRNINRPVVREYCELLAKARPGTEPAILELDGFVNAKILVEGLRRAGKNPNRASLAAALESLGRFDAGGYVVTYSRQNHNGTSFVDLAIAGANGKLRY